jgi:hypothetical protein
MRIGTVAGADIITNNNNNKRHIAWIENILKQRLHENRPFAMVLIFAPYLTHELYRNELFEKRSQSYKHFWLILMSYQGCRTL